MASAEENILLTRLLDLFCEDPDRIRLFVQAGTNRTCESITNNSPSLSSTASSPAADSPGSRSSDPEDLPAANSSIFTADELLKPRSRGMKATAAQQTFAVSDELEMFCVHKGTNRFVNTFVFLFSSLSYEKPQRNATFGRVPHILKTSRPKTWPNLRKR